MINLPNNFWHQNKAALEEFISGLKSVANVGRTDKGKCRPYRKQTRLPGDPKGLLCQRAPFFTVSKSLEVS